MTLRFTPQWRFTAAFLILLPILISMGFWQLSRAEQKRQLAADFQLRQAAQPVAVELMLAAINGEYTPVNLRGKFLSDKTLFLDNQIHKGVFGFDVIQPFALASGKALVLVNRGWVPADSSRRKLPIIPALTEELALVGYIHQPAANHMIDGAIREIGWPLLIQQVELPRIQALFAQPLAPFVVRLNGEQRAAFDNTWPIVNIDPTKHTAYAVQWFALAITLVLLLIVINSNIIEWLKRSSSQSSH